MCGGNVCPAVATHSFQLLLSIALLVYTSGPFVVCGYVALTKSLHHTLTHLQCTIHIAYTFNAAISRKCTTHAIL